MALEDAADVDIKTLTINGDKLSVDTAKAIESCEVTRSMNSAPVLTIVLFDPLQMLVTSGIFQYRISAQIDGRAFELTKITKQGSKLSVLFESTAIAEMRRHTYPVGIKANTQTRLDFAKKLLAEIGWIPIYQSPGAKLSVTQVALARGTVTSTSADTTADPNYFNGGSTPAKTGSLSAVDVARLGSKAGWSGNDLVLAVAVSRAESGFNPGAVNKANSNGTEDYGLWQINSVHSTLFTKYDWKDGQQNAYMAKAVWDGRKSGHGWEAWSTYTNGKYRSFMAEAQAAVNNISSLEDLSTGQAVSSDVSANLNKYQRQSLSGDAEDTWECIKRIFAEIGWNCYVDYDMRSGGWAVYVGPDSGFITPLAEIDLMEGAAGVDTIDYDFDLGKTEATATVTCRSHRWQLPPGTMVNLPTTGLPNPWLVDTNERSFFSLQSTVTLKRPQPELPEPEAPSGASQYADASYFGNAAELAASDPTGQTSVSTDTSNTQGNFASPINIVAKITDSFGSPRPGKNANGFPKKHQGIDYGVPVSTPVYASRDGTIKLANGTFDPSGYGLMVIIQHDHDSQTYYAHLSKIGATVGNTVKQGDLIGFSGATGNPSGPCLHFEVRIAGVPNDPVPWLNGVRYFGKGY